MNNHRLTDMGEPEGDSGTPVADGFHGGMRLLVVGRVVLAGSSFHTYTGLRRVHFFSRTLDVLSPCLRIRSNRRKTKCKSAEPKAISKSRVQVSHRRL